MARISAFGNTAKATPAHAAAAIPRPSQRMSRYIAAGPRVMPSSSETLTARIGPVNCDTSHAGPRKVNWSAFTEAGWTRPKGAPICSCTVVPHRRRPCSELNQTSQT